MICRKNKNKFLLCALLYRRNLAPDTEHFCDATFSILNNFWPLHVLPLLPTLAWIWDVLIQKFMMFFFFQVLFALKFAVSVTLIHAKLSCAIKVMKSGKKSGFFSFVWLCAWAGKLLQLYHWMCLHHVKHQFIYYINHIRWPDMIGRLLVQKCTHRIEVTMPIC